MSSSEQEALLGQIIDGRYRIAECLRIQDMQIVFRAADEQTATEVVFKLLRPTNSDTERFSADFFRQAHLISQINHPSVLGLSDFGFYEDRPFVVTPTCDGRSMNTYLSEYGPPPVNTAIELCAQICAAIAAGHSIDVIHSSINGDTIMINPGTQQIFLVDFGFSRLLSGNDAGGAMTPTGQLIGDPQYLAPEQIRGETVSRQTDVYSVATLTYMLIAGTVPFPILDRSAEGIMDVLMKQATEPPKPLSDFQELSGIPEEIDIALRQGLAKAPSARPQSIEAFAQQLQQAASSIGTKFSLPPGDQEILIQDELLEAAHQSEDQDSPEPTQATYDNFSPTAASEPSDPPSYTFAAETTEQHANPVSSFDEESPTYEEPNATSEEQTAQPESQTPPFQEPMDTFDYSDTSDSEQMLDQNFNDLDFVNPGLSRIQERSQDSLFESEENIEQDLSQSDSFFDSPEQESSLASQALDNFDSAESDANFEREFSENDDVFQTPTFSNPPKQQSAIVGMLLKISLVSFLVVALGLGAKFFLSSRGANDDQDLALSRPPAGVDEVEVPDEPVSDDIASMGEAPEQVEPEDPETEAIPLDQNGQPVSQEPLNAARIGIVDLEQVILKSIVGKHLEQKYMEAYQKAKEHPQKDELIEELHRRNTEIVSELLVEVRDIIKTYGQANGFALIVGKSKSLTNAPWVDPSVPDPQSLVDRDPMYLNLDEEIIAEYNKLYQ